MSFEQENPAPDEPRPEASQLGDPQPGNDGIPTGDVSRVGDSSTQGSSVPGSSPSVDHDTWVAEWAKKDSSTNDSGQPDASESETSDNEQPEAATAKKTRAKKTRKKSEKNPNPSGADSTEEERDDDVAKNATPKFAAAVGDFLKRTPVRLDAETKAALDPKSALVTPLDESELVYEPQDRPAATTVRGKLARAFTSDKTTAALGVFGELLITGGAVVLLFLAWQLWINNAIVAGEQAQAVKAFSNNITSSPSSSSLWTPKAGATDYGPAPVLAPVGQDAVIGNMYVPRLGSGSTRAVANGVENPGATINRGYYGKYEDSQWPGEPGNFAMAVHRTGWGTSFTDSHKLRPGDHMYLETPQGWYIYTIRNIEYVVPTQVDVVNPMPLSNDPPVDGQSIMTITTCSPMNGNGERLVVYGILSSWQPLEAGIPTEITKLVEEARA